MSVCSFWQRLAGVRFSRRQIEWANACRGARFAATKAIIQALTSNDTLSVLGLQNTVTGSVGAAEADMGDESKANGGGNSRGAASPSNKGKKDTADAPTAAPHKPAMPTVLSLYDIVDSVCAERGKLVSVSLEWPELVRASRKL